MLLLLHSTEKENVQAKVPEMSPQKEAYMNDNCSIGVSIPIALSFLLKTEIKELT